MTEPLKVQIIPTGLEARQELIRQLIGLAAMAVAVLAMDQRFRVELKAFLTDPRRRLREITHAYRTGSRFTEWLAGQRAAAEAPAVIAEAEAALAEEDDRDKG